MLTAKNKKFYLDGEEFKIQSGAFHYFRALPEYWEDILLKIKAAGLNCVESYTCWNLHEPKKGKFDFSGMLDIERFIRTAQKVGLKVIFRTGPYICAEWENGGFPSWLLKKEYNIRLRCNTEPYMTHLKDWFHVLFSKIRPYLDVNGGPVIAMAIENEYGTFGDDFTYLLEIEKIYRNENMNCLYFAADGNTRYHLSTGKCSKDIIHGMDFGAGCISNIESFNVIDEFDDNSPYFASEYWAGNFTDWRYEKCAIIPDDVVKHDINFFVDIGASFNIYMMFGGSNFGFTSGAQGKQNCMQYSYNPCVTGYDYDAAITEWRGYTQRYFDIKEAMERDHGASDVALPSSPKLQSIGRVDLCECAYLFDNLHIGKQYKSVTVEPMEEFDQTNGYIMYSKTFDYNADINVIKMVGIRDRAYVSVNKKLVAVRMRGEDESPVLLENNLKSGDRVDILVENMGRICFGEETYRGDRKGILEAVVVTKGGKDFVQSPGKTVFNWDVTCLEMDDISAVAYKDGTCAEYPAFFKGYFKAENKNSCYVHFDNFTKGVIYVNGFNLGRYWNRGPITALYIPGAILKENNEIVVFETDGVVKNASVTINDISGTPNHHKEVIV